MSAPSLARRERHALCDLALVLGKDAPTLCGDWTAHELVAHLLLRETRPLGALGLVVPLFSPATERDMAALVRRPFPVLVERLRDPGLTPFALPAVERRANTMEYFVHHEDLRRARPGWTPRSLDEHDQSRIWAALRPLGRALVRRAGVPVTIRRSDTGATATLRGGADPVVLSGPPAEVALRLFGRTEVDGVELDGPASRVAAFREAGLGL
jgi:uncharacterized protein (TIGR03085 family)